MRLGIAVLSAAIAFPPAAVDGGGAVAFSSPGCNAPGYVHLTMSPERSDRWYVTIEAISQECGGRSGGMCTGLGTLAEGVKIDCPGAADGSLSPVVVCYPGPMAPPPVQRATSTLQLSTSGGSFDGTIDLVLAGDVGVGNVCV